jgi:Uma2 family endonuclease
MSEMAASSSEHVRLRPITVEEYHRMGLAGILGSDERVELLNGRILEMPPIGPRHAYIVTGLYDLLRATFQGRAVVRSQQPLTLGSSSEPEPDVVLVCGPPERYESAHPTAAEALLVVEVSDATLPFDRGEKLVAYAQGGVPEYWIVNLVDGVIEQFAEPDGAKFREHRVAHAGERVTPRAFPDHAIAVDDILPPRRV